MYYGTERFQNISNYDLWSIFQTHANK
jgi:hypothetical protein